MTVSYGHGISVSPMHLINAPLRQVWPSTGTRMKPMTLVKDGTKNASRQAPQILSQENGRKYARPAAPGGAARHREICECPGLSMIGGKDRNCRENRQWCVPQKIRKSTSFVGVFPTNRSRATQFS
jgi:hypothetical protein